MPEQQTQFKTDSSYPPKLDTPAQTDNTANKQITKSDNKNELADTSREQSVENENQQIVQKLDEILTQLKQLNKVNMHRDFSFARLIGAISQILVIGMLFWTIVGLIDLGEISLPTATTFKILGATLLQMIALTFFVLDQQDK